MPRPSAVGKKTSKHNPEACQVSECVLCKLKKPFELPPEIVSAYRHGKLVIFAGSGVSTESREVYPSTFYQYIKNELNLPEDEKIRFSKLMTLYSSSPRSRKDLLKAIRHRIEYVKTFPELYNRATEFHQELSTIPHLDLIFTTNWDDFFERECYATPIVTGQDYAVLEGTPGRKVFKLHGTINSFGSIIATENDYRKCYKQLNTGIIGGKLKLLLMSKTVVFFGFSFDDEDFQRLYRLLKKELGGMMPRSYVITLAEKATEKLNSLGINATPIITSAAFFVQQFKEKLIEEKLMVPDKKFTGIYTALRKLAKENDNTSMLTLSEHPDSIYSLFYQDGLIHAFERLLNTKDSGQNSCPNHIIKHIEYYDTLIKERSCKKDYPDVAYFIGYQSGLIYFLLDEKDRLSFPMYFLFGSEEIIDFEQYIKLEKNAAKMHKTAHKLAERIASRITEGMVIHHTPFS